MSEEHSISWRLLEGPRADAAWNMALDEALLEAAVTPTLRLYRWSEPSLSLGVLQRHAEIPVSMASAACVVCRRVTGGGAILHRESELTFALSTGLDDRRWPRDARAGVDLINSAVRTALQACGVAVDEQAPATRYGRDRPFDCFARATELDVAAGNLKLAGSAQRRKRGRVLLHGSVPDAPDGIDRELASAIAAVLGVELVRGELTPEELDLTRHLMESRHRKREWVERR